VVRSLSNSFAGIAPGDVPAFILAQLAGACLGAVVAHFLFGRVSEPQAEPRTRPDHQAI
jgi:glycerol uptake facilitator-like aquaporin